MTWFSDPPPQPESKWRVVADWWWVRHWRDFLVVLVAVAASVLVIAIIVDQLIIGNASSTEPEPGEVRAVLIVTNPNTGEDMTCIRIDGIRGVSCDWD